MLFQLFIEIFLLLNFKLLANPLNENNLNISYLFQINQNLIYEYSIFIKLIQIPFENQNPTINFVHN
jgi:hypothetical protein